MNKNICLIGLFGVLTLATAMKSQAQCVCTCDFPRSKQIVLIDKLAASVGTQYSFRPNFSRNCTGAFCSIEKVEYAWTIDATSTATFTIEGGTDSFQFVVTVTGSGKLDLSCTVNVTCGKNVTQCSAVGTRTFRVSQ